MAKIKAQVVGGEVKDIYAANVKEAKEQLSATTYTANINGDPVDNDYALEDGDFLTLAPAVKGA